MSSRGLSRRDALKAIAAGMGAVGLGCTGNAESPPIGIGDGRADGNGWACGSAPLDWRKAREKITSVVVLCMENRSFDHYFGAFSLPRSQGGLGVTDIDGLVGDEFNVDRYGNEVGVHNLQDFSPHDLPHEWDLCQQQFGDGRNDGFVSSAEDHALEHFEKLQKKVARDSSLSSDELAAVMAREAMGYYTSTQIPVMYELAKQSVLCENWYSSVMGPTWTNRFYLHGATAKGLKDNLGFSAPVDRLNGIRQRLVGWESILDIVEKRNGLEAVNYYHDVSWLRLVNPDTGRELRNQFEDMVSRFDRLRPTGFFARARANRLPPFSLIDPHFGTFNGRDANDDHPDPGGSDDHDVRKGQALIASVVNALAQNSDQWNRTLLIITYDEHGGFFDHVAPPTTYDALSDFRQLGFRVPALVVGPYVRRGCAVSTTFDHGSILRTVQNVLNLRRDFADSGVRQRLSVTNDLLSCLDANALEGRPHPAPTLSPVAISLNKWRELDNDHTYHMDLRYAAQLRLRSEELRRARDPYILERVLAEGELLGAVHTTT